MRGWAWRQCELCACWSGARSASRPFQGLPHPGAWFVAWPLACALVGLPFLSMCTWGKGQLVAWGSGECCGSGLLPLSSGPAADWARGLIGASLSSSKHGGSLGSPPVVGNIPQPPFGISSPASCLPLASGAASSSACLWVRVGPQFPSRSGAGTHRKN